MENSFDDLARAAKREYMRQWRRKNPERDRAIRERYWARKGSELAARQEAKQRLEIGGDGGAR